MSRFESFRTRTTGKWILTGEHAVLRGITAIALPLTTYALTLKYTPNDSDRLVFESPDPESIRRLLDALRDGWENQGRTFPIISGTLSIESTIPIGAGLGSSAALCVAISRWLDEPLGLTTEASGQSITEFARELEHHFHGKSSGLDVTVIQAGEPMAFVSGRAPTSLNIRKLPTFTFHDTGLRSNTRDCIIRVEDQRDEDPARAMHIDERMGQATRFATEGLVRFQAGDSQVGLGKVRDAMNLAHQCFEEWNLVPEAIRKTREEILKRGALAVKLTGSGNGGFLVALWPDET